MKSTQSLLVLFILIISSYGAYGQLSKTEKKLIKAIEAQNRDAEEFLIEMVNINSGSMNFEGVRKVGVRFAQKFEQIGMETEWIEGKDFGRAGHLVARQKGKGPKILLIGHLDTVFELESPFQKATVQNDSTVSGPGICDMKGGNVIILQALSALHRIGKLKSLNISVVMTGDEELAGRPLKLAREVLKAEAGNSQYVLGFENGDGNPATAVVSRRGASSWKLIVKGNPSHSSQVFSESVGAGAVYEASRILNSFYEELSTLEYLTFNPGLILGGTLVDHDDKLDAGYASGKNNVVSQQVITTGDIRTISQEQYAEVKTRMRNIVADHRPQTQAEIEFNDGYPALPPSDGNNTLLGYLSEASEDLGYGKISAVDPMKAGAADVSFASGLAPMIIDGLGLGGIGDHTEGETAYLNTLPMQTERTAVLIWRLSSEIKIQ